MQKQITSKFRFLFPLALVGMTSLALTGCGDDTNAESGSTVVDVTPQNNQNGNCVINNVSFEPKAGSTLTFGSTLRVRLDYTLKHSEDTEYVRFNGYLVPTKGVNKRYNTQDAFRNGRAAGRYVKDLEISIDRNYYDAGTYSFLTVQHHWGTGCDETYAIGYTIK